MRGTMATNCQSLKANFLEFLTGAINVAEIKGSCVLTLPQKTVDDRRPTIFVQENLPGYFIVHDGGKTAAELFAQGVHITDLRQAVLEDLAARYGATFVKGTFRIGCQADDLNSAIVAMAQCATLGTWQILAQKPKFEDEPVLHRVEAGMLAWRAPYEHDIRPRVRIRGVQMEHVLDFASFPRHVQRSPIG